MLELRPTCERCYKELPPESTEAMICSFECTFCISCVEKYPEKKCPNCGGEFQKRPIRPKHLLEKFPASTDFFFKPRD
ncbi:DUF1272 domain-containing protein [uncultured Fluviicola sp.]|uniref:DUF1272 domain-containing protein n=1 Tax=uncultured Fluviicola sp. TaxID=463303 RepID=UPI0025D2C4FC|nr:DUF1272 domain-containing protein [uncultured Fluviicola sp.]